MKTKILLVLATSSTLLFAGCSDDPKLPDYPAPKSATAKFRTLNGRNMEVGFREICLDGVVYYHNFVHGGSSFSPKWKDDNGVAKLVTCK